MNIINIKQIFVITLVTAQLLGAVVLQLLTTVADIFQLSPVIIKKVSIHVN